MTHTQEERQHMRKNTIGAAVAAALAVVVIAGCEVPEDDAPGKASQTQTEQKSEQPEQNFTPAQEQAIGTAESYLEFQAFSREGLIAQLKFEKFSVKDATIAVDSLDVDWTAQAKQSARDYLASQNFSRQGLIDQLEFEGFTTQQATAGVEAAGL